MKTTLNQMKITLNQMRLICFALMALAVLVIVPSLSAAPNVKVMPPTEKAFGKSYGQWAAAWWQWGLAIPVGSNPLLDTTGVNCGVDQSGPVWFLVGAFGGTADRACTLPSKALFFPIVNNVGLKTEATDTEASLRALVKPFIDDARDLSLEVDGVSIPIIDRFRVQSPYFTVNLPADNLVGLHAGKYQAVDDGYYVMLAPLSEGAHTVHFQARSNQGFRLDVTYHLTVRD